MVDTSKFYTVKQLSEKKGVSKEAVAKWLKKEKVPCETFEKMILVPKDHPKVKEYDPRPYPKKGPK